MYNKNVNVEDMAVSHFLKKCIDPQNKAFFWGLYLFVVVWGLVRVYTADMCGAFEMVGVSFIILYLLVSLLLSFFALALFLWLEDMLMPLMDKWEFDRHVKKWSTISIFLLVMTLWGAVVIPVLIREQTGCERVVIQSLDRVQEIVEEHFTTYGRYEGVCAKNKEIQELLLLAQMQSDTEAACNDSRYEWSAGAALPVKAQFIWERKKDTVGYCVDSLEQGSVISGVLQQGDDVCPRELRGKEIEE